MKIIVVVYVLFFYNLSFCQKISKIVMYSIGETLFVHPLKTESDFNEVIKSRITFLRKSMDSTKQDHLVNPIADTVVYINKSCEIKKEVKNGERINSLTSNIFSKLIFYDRKENLIFEMYVDKLGNYSISNDVYKKNENLFLLIGYNTFID